MFIISLNCEEKTMIDISEIACLLQKVIAIDCCMKEADKIRT